MLVCHWGKSFVSIVTKLFVLVQFELLFKALGSNGFPLNQTLSAVICVTFRFFLQLADKVHATVQVGNYLAVLCVLWEDSIQSILYLKPVICFASPVATFHLTDARQVYG